MIKKKFLSDILNFKNGKKRPTEEGTVPVYGGNGILGYANSSNSEECIIIGRVGAYCGNVYYEKKKCWISDNAISAYVKEGIDIVYAYYLLKSLHLNKRKIGTSQPLLTQEILNNIEISIIPYFNQIKVGKILSIIDEKIYLNTEINNNLEQQISALYQTWFEDFNIANGICPEHWSNQELSSVADISSGKRPPIKSKSYSRKTPIPIVGASSVMGFTSEANHTDRILVTGRVGTHGVVQRFNTPCWTSDNTLVIKSPYYEFVNQILQRIDYSSMNRGSTQPLITQGDMKKVRVLIPDSKTLIRFESFAGTLMNQWDANEQENVKLASLRDTLLPKLMSGKLDVSDIDL